MLTAIILYATFATILCIALGTAYAIQRRKVAIYAKDRQQYFAKVAELMREQRTGRRNVDDDGVWVPLTDDELMRLAKTGCKSCHGAGYTLLEGARGVCPCVTKRMRGNNTFGLSAGVPVRRATPEEAAAANTHPKDGGVH